MTDHKTIANCYIDLWNERAPQRRREMLAANWTTDATYVDPLMSGDGQDGVDALISGVQQRFPDFKFRLIGEPNGFGDHVRFSWGLGPDGRQPDQGNGFRGAPGWAHPQHHRVSRSGAGGVMIRTA